MNAIALLAGSLFKLTDELFDTQNKYLLEYSEYIKTGCIVFMTLFFFLNPEWSLLFTLLLIPTCYSLNQIDTTFWKSMIPIPLITLTLTVQHLKYIGFSDLLEKCSVVFLTCLVCVYEDKIFPEETSQEKTMFRAMIVCIGILALYLAQFFKSPEFYRAGIYIYPIAYCGTSVLVKTFLTEEPSSDSLSHSGESNTYTYETS
jgi:hypothetical protein